MRADAAGFAARRSKHKTSPEQSLANAISRSLSSEANQSSAAARPTASAGDRSTPPSVTKSEGFAADIDTQAREAEQQAAQARAEADARLAVNYAHIPELYRRLVARLRAAGVRTREEETSLPVAQDFQGMQFVLTGSLTSISRDEAKAAIEARGGRVTSSVSKKTSVVVVGEDAGAKHEKAKELGLTCVDETEFRRRLGLP